MKKTSLSKRSASLPLSGADGRLLGLVSTEPKSPTESGRALGGLAAAAAGEEHLNETEEEEQKKGKQETCFSVSQAVSKADKQLFMCSKNMMH